MTDLITEARELATENISQPTVFYKDKSQRIMLRLCDALENAEKQLQEQCDKMGAWLEEYNEMKIALREAQRWIPVTERLPEDGNDVLVVASGKPRDNLKLDGAYEFASYLKNDGGWFFDAYPDWETPTITHWMPLPAQPEKEEGV